MNEVTSQLFKDTFHTDPTHQAFAPGRIEFIGNHTDYNGGLVMGAAVTEGITVAVSLRTDRKLAIVSDAGSKVELSIDALNPVSGLAAWTNYPVGVAVVMRDLGMSFETGFNMAVTSNLPAGAGMSSSAAFELATAKALAALYGYETDTAGFARIGRQAENEFVGVPCGILDQGVSAFGQADQLVRIDCATETFSTIPMPGNTHFWIFNSNKKHSLVDSHYADRHKECHEARDVIQAKYPEVTTLSEASEAQVRELESALGDVCFRRALHVVTENARVRAVEAALASGDIEAVGTALSASHESSRVNFENSIPELDTLVGLLQQQAHVYGARLTGGGFGGAVMALTGPEFGQAEAKVIAEAYHAAHGLETTVIHTQAGEGATLL